MAEVNEEVLNKLVDAVDKLSERVEKLEEQLANGKQQKEYQQQKLPLTIKRGDRGFLLFLNSYKMVRNSPMLVLNQEQLMQLKAEIDKLLSVKTAKGKKVKKKEGFEEAVEDE